MDEINAERKQLIADAFNEWARRVAAGPGTFQPMLQSNGLPVEDYGQKCATYFLELLAEAKIERARNFYHG